MNAFIYFLFNKESWKKVSTKTAELLTLIIKRNEHIQLFLKDYTEDWSIGCCKFRLVIIGINYIWKYIKSENIETERQRKMVFIFPC